MAIGITKPRLETCGFKAGDSALSLKLLWASHQWNNTLPMGVFMEGVLREAGSLGAGFTSNRKGTEPMAIIESIPVLNRLGLHLRMGAELVRVAGGFKCQVRVSHGGRSVNAKSLLQLLTLGAIRGTVLEFSASGEDAPEAIAAIRVLLKSWGEENES
jgi:phosphocarrier protein